MTAFEYLHSALCFPSFSSTKLLLCHQLSVDYCETIIKSVHAFASVYMQSTTTEGGSAKTAEID